ncbi:MAG: NADH:flavin oxidoreductase/NADH oxidase family protein [Pseudomonadota bacterium]
MIAESNPADILGQSLALPCGAEIKNRIVKSAMSDSLGDGEGNPTEAQIRLYERWANGGAALSFIGEVQGDPRYPEKPGNLVLGETSETELLTSLTHRAVINRSHLWPQIGHAGALSHLPISKPKGPSPIDVDGLHCGGLSADEVQALPAMYARAASHAKAVGFSGVHIHAGHGFLLSQFLSPLFNHRTDGYGGSVEGRCRIILEIVHAVRKSVGADFPIGVRINASDQLEGGLTEADSLETIRMLDQSSIDLIDISGGTYFPGAPSSSDRTSSGPYFVDFSERARKITDVPLMLTGGFKTREQAIDALARGACDIVGVARAIALDPDLPNRWLTDEGGDPQFPRFASSPPGGITAWYTMRLTSIGENNEEAFDMDLESAIQEYDQRDAERSRKWKMKFPHF